MANPPHLKYESPAESLVDNFSSPGTQYPSLFPDSMDPSQVMTPQSYDDDSMFGDDVGASIDGTPAPEKKQVKKRKSWGQQLPEPKTNLPPRKRAKTEDEKEQRRVERVLRNRRAAQSSRERKRQEVEALEAEKQAIEQRNRDLEMRLADAQAKNALLQRELEQYTGNSGMRVFQGSSAASTPAAEQFRAQSPVTLSQELFGSRDRQRSSITSMTETPQTVNPASLSPEIRPVAESSNASSSDMTQHPAAMLCDLQCQSEEQRPWTNSTTPTTLSLLLTLSLLINTTSAAISTLLHPLTQILTSLNTTSPLSPTPSILTTIIWLLTTTSSLTTSNSTSSSPTTPTTSRLPPRSRFSLRMPMLKRLLTCSPNLARPLMDATMEAMRLASEQLQLPRTGLSRVVDAASPSHGEVIDSPSVESLMTLLWAIEVIVKEQSHIKMEDRTKSDVAAEMGQVCREVDELFRDRDMKRVSFTAADGRHGTKKSLDGWRLA